jgi:putative tricarboxylic transport membrane protein
VRKPHARADLVTAAAFFVFAAAVMGEALRMPRFSSIGATSFTDPGIVPGFYAIIIGLLAVALGLRAIREGALRNGPAEPDPEAQPKNLRHRAIAAALGMIFVVGLVGRLPFWLAAAIFVAAFIIVFEWRPGLTPLARLRSFVAPLVIALATGLAVTYVFQEIFLVRLP